MVALTPFKQINLNLFQSQLLLVEAYGASFYSEWKGKSVVAIHEFDDFLKQEWFQVMEVLNF